MKSFIDLLKANPNCRVTIVSSKPKHRAEAGDAKYVRGKLYLRQQVLTRDGYHCRRGRPVYEWVKAEDARNPQYRSGWTQPPRKKSTKEGGDAK